MTPGDALLQQVTEDRDRRCATLRTAAADQSRQIVHAARAEALKGVRNAVTQERARLDFGLRQATARADIEVRRREQQTSRELLQQMWAGMAQVLTRRWRDPSLRRAWSEAAVRQAGRLLSGRPWRIETSAEWTPQERTELQEQARSQGAGSVEWSIDASLPAGLRIRTDRVSVDATVPGLLAPRDAIEAAFLAEYLPEQSKDG